MLRSREQQANAYVCTVGQIGASGTPGLWWLGWKQKHWGLVKGLSYLNHSRDTFAGLKVSSLVPLKGSLFCLYILEQEKSLVGVVAYSYT